MIDDYIYEDINELSYAKISKYEKMIQKIGKDSLDKHHYKVASFYSMLQQNKVDFQRIAPLCFSYGTRRTHLLPNDRLLWCTKEQIAEILKLYKENNFFDMEVLMKWKEICQVDKNLLEILDRMTRRLQLMKRHQLYLKSDNFYKMANIISVKDVITYMFPYLGVQTLKPKRKKLQTLFDDDIFIDDKLMDYQKTLERVNEIYSGNNFDSLPQMMTLKECERLLFLENYSVYSTNENYFLKFVSYFENNNKIKKIPCIKSSTNLYYYNDVKQYINEQFL